MDPSSSLERFPEEFHATESPFLAEHEKDSWKVLGTLAESLQLLGFALPALSGEPVLLSQGLSVRNFSEVRMFLLGWCCCGVRPEAFGSKAQSLQGAPPMQNYWCS